MLGRIFRLGATWAAAAIDRLVAAGLIQERPAAVGGSLVDDAQRARFADGGALRPVHRFGEDAQAAQARGGGLGGGAAQRRQGAAAAGQNAHANIIGTRAGGTLAEQWRKPPDSAAYATWFNMSGVISRSKVAPMLNCRWPMALQRTTRYSTSSVSPLAR